MTTSTQIKFTPNNGLLLPYNHFPDNAVDELIPGVYELASIEMNDKKVWGFKPTQNLTIPEGVINQDTQLNRVVSTYRRIGKQMGVLFSGYSGSGKTVLAKRIAMKLCLEDKLPIILVDGESISKLKYAMMALQQRAIFFIDEYEKQFKETEDQNYLLTILDGIVDRQHLLLLTCNDPDKVNPYMLDRPSCLRYHFEFKGVDNAVISKIVDRDYLNPDYASILKLVLSSIPKLTYDMMFEIIRECNLYLTESPLDLVEDLSVPVAKFNSSNYHAQFQLHGKPISAEAASNYVDRFLNDWFNKNNINVTAKANLSSTGADPDNIANMFDTGNNFRYMMDNNVIAFRRSLCTLIYDNGKDEDPFDDHIASVIRPIGENEKMIDIIMRDDAVEMDYRIITSDVSPRAPFSKSITAALNDFNAQSELSVVLLYKGMTDNQPSSI